MSPAPEAAATYSFAAPPARGVLLGLAPARLLGLALGLGGFVMVLVTGGGLALGMVPVAAGAAWCWLPLGERRAHEWAGPVGRHAVAVVSGQRRWSGGLHWAHVGGHGGTERLVLPPELGRARWLAVTQGSWEAGVVVERSGARSTMTVVLAVEATGRWGLADDAERARQVSGWGQVLAALATERSAITGLQWVERAAPAGAPPAGPDGPAAAGARHADYLDLEAACYGAATTHRVHLAAQVRATGRDGEGAERALSEARSLASRLTELGLAALPLGIDALAALVRSYADLAPLSGGGAQAAAPAGRVVAWDHLVTEGLWHRAYAVVAWPRRAVPTTWLEPLLLASCAPAVRTLAVHLVPVPARVALRRAASARMGVALDDAQRQRYGLLDRHAHAREASDADAREAELVAGYAEYRTAGVVLLSAASREALEEGGRALGPAAGAAGVELRVLYGHQDQGWAAAMPLCRARLVGAG